MKQKSISLDVWDKLYKTSAQIRKLAPWEWMNEYDLFVVKTPEKRDPGFVTILGSGGEYFTIMVHLGLEGLNGLWRIQNSPQDIFSHQRIFETPHLQVFFDDQHVLWPGDHNIIKKLKLNFQGKQAWPIFRSIRPGFAPWFLNPAEALFLQHTLEQILDVAPRVKDNPSILIPDETDHFLLRKSVLKKGIRTWYDTVWELPPPPSTDFKYSVNMQAINTLGELTPADAALDIDVFMYPWSVNDKNHPPFFPYVLIMIDRKKGLIIGQEILTPLPNLDKMWSNVPSLIIEQLADQKLLPRTIYVTSGLLCDLLKNSLSRLGVTIKLEDHLPNIEEACNSLVEFLKDNDR